MRAAFLLCAVAAASATQAFANPMQPPKVSYTAEVALTRTGAAATIMHQSFSGHKARVDIDGDDVYFLMNYEWGERVAVSPKQKMATRPMALPDTDPRPDIGVAATVAEEVGSDTILGMKATKYRVMGYILASRLPFSGFVWTNQDNIVLRAAGVTRGRDGESPLIREVRKLDVGPVPDERFKIPTGFIQEDK